MERLLDYAHRLIYRIRQDIPAEHRPTLLAYLVGSFDPESGEGREVEPRLDVEIRCEDCPDLQTAKCDTCSVPRAFEDTVTE